MEGLSRDEISELANCFDPAAATRLLDAARLKRARHPSQARDGLSFWTEVSTMITDGVDPDLRVNVLREAARMFPANRVFADGAGLPVAASRDGDPPPDIASGEERHDPESQKPHGTGRDRQARNLWRTVSGWLISPALSRPPVPVFALVLAAVLAVTATAVGLHEVLGTHATSPPASPSGPYQPAATASTTGPARPLAVSSDLEQALLPADELGTGTNRTPVLNLTPIAEICGASVTENVTEAVGEDLEKSRGDNIEPLSLREIIVSWRTVADAEHYIEDNRNAVEDTAAGSCDLPANDTSYRFSGNFPVNPPAHPASPGQWFQAQVSRIDGSWANGYFTVIQYERFTIQIFALSGYGDVSATRMGGFLDKAVGQFAQVVH
ncbi:effector-associated domain EAD1-containing protein [Frankia sp. Cr1]|uniref:effector-associated domain EAD1-containing protein n=1 Tax=Frankia sp. Cr1 TaxID=3073931 RepID=UPI002AD4B027|nr:effector-associated domain EAD1-containing protein [Frankia sp. Cr1]